MSDGDVLAQIETDKVTIDVKYTEGQGGVVTKVLVSEDDTVSVDQEVRFFDMLVWCSPPVSLLLVCLVQTMLPPMAV